MKYRELGKTGIRVSELAFGCSPLGGSFGPPDEELGIRAVHTAIDLGINLFDVAPLYGGTRAESVLGRALKGIPREKFLVSTKVGRYHPYEFDFSRDRVTRSVEESLNRLGIDHIDVLLCHDVEFVPLGSIIEEAIPALRSLQAYGKVREIGISGYPLKIFREALTKTELDVVLSYCHFSLNDTSLLGLAPLVREKSCGLIAAAPLAMGLLTEQGPPDWHFATAELREVCAEAADHCRSRGVDIALLGMQFALANTPADTTLVGMRSPAEVQRNLDAAATPPDSTLLGEVFEILRPVKELAWPSGLPENN